MLPPPGLAPKFELLLQKDLKSQFKAYYTLNIFAHNIVIRRYFDI